MQWKPLFLLFAADVALARIHGHQRRHNALHQNHHADSAPEAAIKARQAVDLDVNVKTVLDLDIVTVTTTIFGEPPAEPTSTTQTSEPSPVPTTASATITSSPEAPASSSTNHNPIDIGIGASLGASLSASLGISITLDPTDLLPGATSTSTSSSSSSSSSSTTSTPTTSTPWTSHPTNNAYSTTGFGARTNSSSSGITYTGNVGSPWGSNIIRVDSTTAHTYQYVLRFTHTNTTSSNPWTIVFWNKIGPDGKMDGWYGHSALNLTLSPGEEAFVAMDENSQGAWGAAEGTSLPVDEYGGYSCTWGEFDFGDTDNTGWSGWDVSAIQAQNADQTVQGMRICESTGESCSVITAGAGEVENAYTKDLASEDGIGGSCGAGAVRLVVEIDYS